MMNLMKGYVKIMKIVIGVIYGFTITYNLSFKIWHQIKVRKLMKEEENSIAPMTYNPPSPNPI